MSQRSRRWIWVFLGLGLILLLLAPLLSPERTLFYRDSLPYTAPLNHLIRTSLSQGALPEWDPSQYTGVPFLANPSSQALYPPRWAAVFLTSSPVKASDIFALMHMVLALFGTVALGRELGLKRGPSRLMAVTYTLGGPVMSLLGNLVYLVGAAWLPLSLAWILRARRKAPEGGWSFARALALAAAGLAPPFYAGDPQTAGWLALLTVIVFLAPGGERSAPGSRRLFGLIALGATTLVLTLALLVPAALLSAETTRDAMSYETIGRWSFHPARLSELLVPFPLGLPYPGSSRFLGRALEPNAPDLWTHTFFLGAGTLLFVLRGLGPLVPEQRRARRALVILAVVALALAFGRHTPLHGWICDYTPYSIFRYPEKHLTLVSLALAGLAGFGLQSWLRTAPWQSPRRLLPFLVLPALALLLIWPLSEWGSSLVGPQQPMAIGRVVKVPPAIGGQALATTMVQLWLLGLLALPRLSPRRRTTLIVIGVALTSVSVMGRLVFEGPARLVEETPVTVLAFREQVPARPMEQRLIRYPTSKPFGRYPVAGDMKGGEAAALMYPLTLNSATCALYDLEGLLGMTGFYPRRLARLQKSMSWHKLLQRGAVGHIIGPITPTRAQHSLFDVGLKIGMFPTQGRPRLELLTDLHWVPSEEKAWAALAEVSTRTVVAVGPGSTAPEAHTIGEVRVAPTTGPSNKGFLSLETSAPTPALLVIRDAWFPGWEATLDGSAVPIVHVDGAFMGVQVPAGEHALELRYRTPGFRPGLAISLPAWLALLLFLVGGAFRQRWLR